MDSKPLDEQIAELEGVDAADAPDLADEIAAKLATELEAPPGSGNGQAHESGERPDAAPDPQQS